jgi:very-short-patch-repair endonuclease
MERELIKNNISYKKQVPISGIAVVDFLLRDRLIVQCDGDHWHNLPGKKIKDATQDIILNREGYEVLRFTETEINKNIGGCVEKILTAISGDKL